MTRANGPFDVKLAPLGNDPSDDGLTLSRFSLDKQFRGDLEGTSKGEMLAAGTPVKGSAGYVAVERVTGTLHGRRGSFMLQHTGTMANGAQQLTISVVPDSGTGELVGLSGSMKIIIAAGGAHAYELAYEMRA
jgi:hypothetical protein